MPNPTPVTKGGALVQDTINTINNDFANCFLLSRGQTQNLSDLFTELTQDGITAYASGGQANATPLTAQTNRVTTVASPGASVMLPPSAPGLEVAVINGGANPMQVFGAGTDTINNAPTANSVSQMANSVVIYVCPAAGVWLSDGLGAGYAGSLPTQSAVNGLTAKAGGGQSGATPLTASINRLTTVATAGDSVMLPASAVGLNIYVANAGAQSSNVFPYTGEMINALAANAAFAVPAGKTACYICANVGQWHAILSS